MDFVVAAGSACGFIAFQAVAATDPAVSQSGRSTVNP
jgi:hypothetical protein